MRILLAVVLISLAVSFEASGQAQNIQAGEILKKSGVVKVDGKLAEVGSPIFEGSLVRSEGGTATIVLFNDEGILHVAENTEIKVEKYKPQPGAETSADIRLRSGKFRMLLKTKPGGREKFNLKSRNVIMGIRGTEVVLINPPQASSRQRFVVLDGRAEVWGRTGQPIVLNRLEMVETGADQLDSVGVQKLTEKEASQLSNSIGGSDGGGAAAPASPVKEPAPGSETSGGSTGDTATIAPVAPTLDQHRALPKLPSTGSTGVVIDVQQGN